MKIAISQIIPDPNQPRKTFKEETLQELRNSYQNLGLIQPITVRPYDGKYQIVIGERRYQAALLDRQTEIECIVRDDIDDRKAIEMQFAENIEHEDIPDDELGQAFLDYCKKCNVTENELSHHIGKGDTFVYTRTALVKNASSLIKGSFKTGELKFSEATTIATISSHKRQDEIAQPFIKGVISSKHVSKVVEMARKEPDRPIADILNDIFTGKTNIEEMARAEAIKMASDIPLETPEDKERAAKALLQEVREQRKKLETPEQKTAKQAEREAKRQEREARTKERVQKLSLGDIEAIVEKVVQADPTLANQLWEKLGKQIKQVERREERLAVPFDGNQHHCDIFLADISLWEKQIAPGVLPQSIDAIITDPPYPQEFLHLFSPLAAFANYALKPSASLFVMVGQSYLPNIIAMLSEHLTYHWILAYLTPGGQSPQLWQRNVNSFWKPVLWFTNGAYKGKWLGDVVKSEVNDNDKDFHKWGQSESGMADLIERATEVGDLILDPFMGGATTGRVALELGRGFIGIDNSVNAVEIAKQRLGIKK